VIGVSGGKRNMKYHRQMWIPAKPLTGGRERKRESKRK